MHLPRTSITLSLLLPALMTACTLPGKVCIGDCDGDDDDAGTDVSASSTAGTITVTSLIPNETDQPPTDTSTGEAEDPTTEAEDPTTVGEPAPSCVVPDTIEPSASCMDGVAAPGELCFNLGVGSGGNPFKTTISTLPGQLTPGGVDIVQSHGDGTVTNILDGTAPFFDITSVDWQIQLAAPLVLTDVGDLDEDGHPDVVGRVPGAAGDDLEILFIDADAALAGTASIPEARLLFGPAIVDWDQDDHLDLVVIRDGQASDDIVVLHGDGAGNFTASVETGLTLDGKRIAMGVLDDDGVADDFAFVDGGGDTTLQISGPTDTIYFTSLAPGLVTRDVQIGQLGGDARGDVVVLADDTLSGTSSIYVLTQVGTRDRPSFTIDSYPVLCGARTLALGRVDGDAATDIVVAGSSEPTAMIRRNDGQGDFSAVFSTYFEADIDQLFVVDHSGDGFPDIVGANQTLFAFTGSTP